MSNSGVTKWPFGTGPEVIALTATGAQAITVNNQFTIVDGVTVEATGNRTINVTLGDNLKVGALLLSTNKTNATETTTYGTGITSAVTTGVSGKTINQLFIYNGTAFVAAGAQQQID
jgi:hypothetical protein